MLPLIILFWLHSKVVYISTCIVQLSLGNEDKFIRVSMGCVSSKQKERLCRNCNASCSPPIQRHSYSHVRSNEFFDPFNNESFHKIEQRLARLEDHAKIVDKFSVGLVEAKKWSELIDQRISKIVPMTPIRTPPGEPESINAWELMEGLDDISPLRPVNYLRSMSLQFGPNLVCEERRDKREYFSKPMWLELADMETNSTSMEFDPNVISTFREAFEEEKDTEEILPIDDVLEGEENREILENRRKVEWENSAEILEKEENKESEENMENFEASGKTKGNDYVEMTTKEENLERVDQVKSKIVLYYTSLRGVRKTYEDCCHVRVILKLMGVKVDERDVSMHSGFKEELKELLGDLFSISPLPRVFLGHNCIGGAEKILQMHEAGRLEKMLLDRGELTVNAICEACGDVRFVPCEKCSGSCKIYYGDEYDYYDENENEAKDCDESGCGFQKCHCCNENGLVRCPICCD